MARREAIDFATRLFPTPTRCALFSRAVFPFNEKIVRYCIKDKKLSFMRSADAKHSTPAPPYPDNLPINHEFRGKSAIFAVRIDRGRFGGIVPLRHADCRSKRGTPGRPIAGAGRANRLRHRV
jgi:hypothetical protein